MNSNYNLFSFLIVVVAIGFLFTGTLDANAQDRCRVTIEKAADPADNTLFEFSVTGDQNFEFTLADPAVTTEIINLIAEEDLDVTVRELVPSGWILDSIECTIPSGGFCGNPNPPPAAVPCLNITEVEDGLNFQCLDSSEVTCTFTNVPLVRNIPTMSQWGLIAMAGILVLIGIWGITRKKAEA